MAYQAHLHRSKQPRIFTRNNTLLRSAVQKKEIVTEFNWSLGKRGSNAYCSAIAQELEAKHLMPINMVRLLKLLVCLNKSINTWL